MPKGPDCDRCLYCAHSILMVCGIYPGGPTEQPCPDFQDNGQPQPEQEPIGLWQPDGASYYGGELVLEPEQRLSLLQKLALLDWHPLFTGRCPNCERPITKPENQPHWDCPYCGWTDDSL